MPADEDLLFGKIALKQGYCTQAQIDECVQMQTLGETDAAVGELLLFKGYISSPQHGKVLEIQKQNLQARAPQTQAQKVAGLFGKLAVSEGLLSEDEVNDCLREQAKDGEKRTLGEIMVSQGHLTAAQVKDLLGKQQKRLMSCPACRLSFTVLSLSQGKQVPCPRCKGPLREGKPSESTRTDAEFATRVLQAAKTEAPPAAKPVTRVIPPSARRVTAICVICDAVFEGAVDSTGRLRCPSCNSTFTPR
jgi:uncharacterized protein YbaR (Trm112 family)